MPIYTTVTSSDLADLAVAIKYEDNGAALTRDLRRNLKKAAQPAAMAAKSSIMSMPSGGMRNVGGSLRASIAKEIRVATKLNKKYAAVDIKVTRKTVREFKNPARRLNRSEPWRHPVRPWKREGKEIVALPRNEWTWVDQRSAKPGWFDDSISGKRAEFEAAVTEAMNETAERIARNA